MSATALAALEASGAPDVLVDYARFVAGLSIEAEAKRHRRNAACDLLNAHPDLKAWMARPTRARLADLARSHAWSFITWCFLEQILVPDLDLLLTKTPGDLYVEWGKRHADDVARVSEIARRYSWSANWTRDVATNALAMVCLWSGNDLDELTDDVFDTFTAALADTPSSRRDARLHNQARAFSLHQACYELRICHHTPRKNRPPAATVTETLQALPQEEIRKVALRYLGVVATTLRPSTVLLRADSLIIFGEYLAAHHPDLRRLEQLEQLERAHIEGFLVWNHHRPWRGWLARDKPVAASVSKRTVVDLRAFFEDLAVWGWADRPDPPTRLRQRHPTPRPSHAQSPSARRRPGSHGRRGWPRRSLRTPRSDHPAWHRDATRRAARPRVRLGLGSRTAGGSFVGFEGGHAQGLES